MTPAPPLRATLLRAALLLCACACSTASEYEYLGWQTDAYAGARGYGKPPQCVDIPEDLRLCATVGYRRMLLPNLLEHDTLNEARQQASSWVPLVHKGCHPGTQLLATVGYRRMLLPNLLEHDTLNEARQQASSWVPLVHKGCHPGTQVFLCALFAPVCLERPVLPCRWLCEAVRAGCAPLMEAFGFPWPDMLSCQKFPQDDVCIAMNPPNATEAPAPTGFSPVCPPCDNEMKTDAMMDHMCASEFAFKAKIKEVSVENSDRRLTLQKRKKVLKAGGLKKSDLKQLVLFLKNGASCPCQQLDHLNAHFLIMGRRVDQQFLLTGIHKWDKASKEFKKAVKKLKTYRCPEFENVF